MTSWFHQHKPSPPLFHHFSTTFPPLFHHFATTFPSLFHHFSTFSLSPRIMCLLTKLITNNHVFAGKDRIGGGKKTLLYCSPKKRACSRCAWVFSWNALMLWLVGFHKEKLLEASKSWTFKNYKSREQSCCVQQLAQHCHKTQDYLCTGCCQCKVLELRVDRKGKKLKKYKS